MLYTINIIKNPIEKRSLIIMKKNEKAPVSETKNHTLLFSTLTSTILSLCVLAGVVIFGIMKVRNNKKHDEKWKDYDECGI